MKKTKCDGETPCKKCKEDGLVCTAGVRKKLEHRQLPRGYAEVLESSQIILVSTVLKLFEMLQQSEGWTLGEVEVNSRGRPVVHHIADLLGCIRPHSDLDLPERSLLPESKENMVALAEHLRQQQEPLEREREQQQQQQQQERQRRGQQDRKETKDQPFNLHPLHKAETGSSLGGMPRCLKARR
jgi:hypothetical protein